MEAARSSSRGSGWGAQWVGLFLGVPSCPEPPGAPWRVAGAELGHCQEGLFRVRVRVRVRVGVRVGVRVRVRVRPL